MPPVTDAKVAEAVEKAVNDKLHVKGAALAVGLTADEPALRNVRRHVKKTKAAPKWLATVQTGAAAATRNATAAAEAALEKARAAVTTARRCELALKKQKPNLKAVIGDGCRSRAQVRSVSETRGSRLPPPPTSARRGSRG